MQLSKDTWHYRNFETWQRRTQSKRHSDLRIYTSHRLNWDTGDWEDKVFGPERQPDLCTYTRIALIWAWPYRIGAWFDKHPNVGEFLIGAFIFTMVYVFLLLLGMLALGEGHPWWQYVLLPFLMAIIGYILGTSAAKVVDWRERRQYARDLEPEPNIVVERIKAHKQKICPMIEFKEEV